jgi:hypothetical protein
VLALHGQDKMALRSGEILSVKIVEFGVAEIKYKLAPFTEDSPIYAKEKTEIARIELSTGEVFTYSSDPFSNSSLYDSQKKRALKINFFSPLNNSTILGFEQSIKPGRSFEVNVGYIGLGWDGRGLNARGGLVRFGYKLMRSPDFYSSGMRYSHALKGGYIKPEINIVSYNADAFVFNLGSASNDIVRENRTGMSLLINIGKQWIFDDVMLLDIFLGVGYGAILNETDTNFNVIEYGFIGGNNDLPIAFNSGVRLGFLIK